MAFPASPFSGSTGAEDSLFLSRLLPFTFFFALASLAYSFLGSTGAPFLPELECLSERAPNRVDVSQHFGSQHLFIAASLSRHLTKRVGGEGNWCAARGCRAPVVIIRGR